MTVTTQAPDEIQIKPQSMFPELRAWPDWALLRISPVYYGINVPRGDGSAVILIPGFLGTDLYLSDLWLWLRLIGYRSFMSGIGINAECMNIVDERLSERVEYAYQQTGRRVKIIGHSLGGISGLSASVAHPDKISQVITLGSPFRAITVNPVVSVTASAVRLLIFLRHYFTELPKKCYTPTCDCPAIKRFRQRRFPSSVDRIAIYTQKDRVARWQDCIYPNNQLNCEVHGGTHTSLAFHRESFEIIARELARCNTLERAVA